MLKKCLCAVFLVHGVAAQAATVELKGKASVTGKILAEKRDMIVIDIGYTALVIPRNQVVHLFDDDQPVGKRDAVTSQASLPAALSDTASAAGFYQVANPNARDNSVRELV